MTVSVGDLVVVRFDPSDGVIDLSPVKGKVLAVDDDPVGYGNTFEFEISDDQANSQLFYTEGEADGESWKMVTRESAFSGSHILGENAEFEVVG